MSARNPRQRSTTSGRPATSERQAGSPPPAAHDHHWGALLLRLAVEAVEIAFIVGIKWALTKWVRYTHQEDEWWARFLMWVAAAYAVIGFTVIAGAELYAACAKAIRDAARRVREE